MGKVAEKCHEEATKVTKKQKYKPFIDRKKAKQTKKEKRARLIIKNLPFKATEESIKDHFKQYGEIVNIELLKKDDGKLVGCAFIQFKLVQFAKQAQHYTNKQPFLGRNIDVDFVKSKDKYLKEKEQQHQQEIKEEKDIKVEDQDQSDNFDRSNIKSENDSEVEVDSISETDFESQTTSKKQPYQSHDVSEGKTIFIKNVPFQATNEDVKQCMLQFGHVYYALVCVDKLTEHSKGTAFVKFVNKEDADKALAAGTELTLLGNILDCHSAIDRNDLKNKVQKEREMKHKPKDSRNLYLVKEGVILAGTKAAEGVSASDMAKRLQIEQYKTQMLRNLNMFVSRDRLVVHNLPQTWDDNKLKMLVEKYGGPGAVVREARIMRNMRKMDSKGVGESKQYGFVAFTKHDNALTALRTLNNNPNIFSAQRRPIITFSIENKAALKAKIKRQEKSRLKNPKAKDYDPTLTKKDDSESVPDVDSNVKSFTGITAKAGTVQKLRSRYKLTEQAKLHYETIKKEKRKQKMSKKTLNEKKKDFIKQDKQKVNKKNKEDNFANLVNNYKKKLMSSIAVKKSKWYE